MKAVLGLGSNLGDRESALKAGLRRLGLRTLRVSSLYETEPVGPVPQGPFLNAVALVETELVPADLLDRIHGVEAALGRRRTVPKGPRTIDIDILLYGREQIATERLTIPHPEMGRRAFVLVPLLEILPEATFPWGGRIDQCQVDRSGVRFHRSAGWYPVTTARSEAP